MKARERSAEDIASVVRAKDAAIAKLAAIQNGNVDRVGPGVVMDRHLHIAGLAGAAVANEFGWNLLGVTLGVVMAAVGYGLGWGLVRLIGWILEGFFSTY